MNAVRKKFLIIIIIFSTFMGFVMGVYYSNMKAQKYTDELLENNKLMDRTIKKTYGECVDIIDSGAPDRKIYKLSGPSGELEPLYIWCKAFPNNLEYNMPSQLMKRYAVDFWENKDRTVYYVNTETGVEEQLSNDINTLERFLEEEWYLKIECKSEDDIEALASELSEWTEYALIRSPYRSPYNRVYCDYSSTKHVADYLELEVVRDETESVFISLSYLYHYELRLTEEPFAEIIEKRLRQCLSF